MHDPGIQIIHQHRELKNCLMQEYAIQTVQIQDYSGTSTSLTQQCMDGKCGGPWGRIIVLASKPHQEHILHIDDFICIMCVSYRKLNSITNTFELPILPCDDDISTIGAR